MGHLAGCNAWNSWWNLYCPSPPPFTLTLLLGHINCTMWHTCCCKLFILWDIQLSYLALPSDLVLLNVNHLLFASICKPSKMMPVDIFYIHLFWEIAAEELQANGTSHGGGRGQSIPVSWRVKIHSNWLAPTVWTYLLISTFFPAASNCCFVILLMLLICIFSVLNWLHWICWPRMQGSGPFSEQIFLVLLNCNWRAEKVLPPVFSFQFWWFF